MSKHLHDLVDVEKQAVSFEYHRAEDSRKVLANLTRECSKRVKSSFSGLNREDVVAILKAVPVEHKDLISLDKLEKHIRNMPFNTNQCYEAAHDILLWVAAEQARRRGEVEKNNLEEMNKDTAGPLQSRNYRSARGRKVLATGIAIVSTGTTYIATRNITGGMLQDWMLEPAQAEFWKMTLSLLVGIFTSAIIFEAKNKVTAFIEKGKSVWQAIEKTMQKMPKLFTFALIMLVISILSNSVGGAMFLGESPELLNQVRKSKKKALETLDIIDKANLSIFARLSDETTDELVFVILEAERLGNSATGLVGEGYFFLAKKAFLEHDGASRAELFKDDMIRTDSYKLKIEELRASFEKYENHEQNDAAFRVKIAKMLRLHQQTFGKSLDALRFQIEDLDSGKFSHEEARARLRNVEEQLNELVNGPENSLISFKQEIEAYALFCTNVISSFNKIANKNKTDLFEVINPNIPKIAIPRLEIPDVTYKNFYEVSLFFVQKNGLLGLLFVIFIVGLCLVLDVMDMLSLEGLRRRVQHDKWIVYQQRTKFLAPIKDVIVREVAFLLNHRYEGRLHHNTYIPPKVIHYELQLLLKSMANQENKKLKTPDDAGLIERMWRGFSGLIRQWARLNTPSVLAYNLDRRILTETFFEDPVHMRKLLTNLFPRSVRNAVFQPDNAGIAQQNDIHHSEVGQAADLDIQGSISKIEAFKRDLTKVDVLSEEEKREIQHYLTDHLSKLHGLRASFSRLSWTPIPEKLDTSEVKVYFDLQQQTGMEIEKIEFKVGNTFSKVEELWGSGDIPHTLKLESKENDITLSVLDKAGRVAAHSFSVISITPETQASEIAPVLELLVDAGKDLLYRIPELFNRTLLNIGYMDEFTLTEVRTCLDGLSEDCARHIRIFEERKENLKANDYISAFDQKLLETQLDSLIALSGSQGKLPIKALQEKILSMEDHKSKNLKYLFDSVQRHRISFSSVEAYIGDINGLVEELSAMYGFEIDSIPHKNFEISSVVKLDRDTPPFLTIKTMEMQLVECQYISKIIFHRKSLLSEKTLQAIGLGKSEEITEHTFNALQSQKNMSLKMPDLLLGENIITTEVFDCWGQNTEAPNEFGIRFINPEKNKLLKQHEEEEKKYKQKIENEKAAEARRDNLAKMNRERTALIREMAVVVTGVVKPFEKMILAFKKQIKMLLDANIDVVSIAHGLAHTKFDHIDLESLGQKVDSSPFKELDYALHQHCDAFFRDIRWMMGVFQKQNWRTTTFTDLADAMKQDDFSLENVKLPLCIEFPESLKKMHAQAISLGVRNRYLVKSMPEISAMPQIGPQGQKKSRLTNTLIEPFSNLLDLYRNIILATPSSIDKAQVIEGISLAQKLIEQKVPLPTDNTGKPLAKAEELHDDIIGHSRDIKTVLERIKLIEKPVDEMAWLKSIDNLALSLLFLPIGEAKDLKELQIEDDQFLASLTLLTPEQEERNEALQMRKNRDN